MSKRNAYTNTNITYAHTVANDECGRSQENIRSFSLLCAEREIESRWVCEYVRYSFCSALFIAFHQTCSLALALSYTLNSCSIHTVVALFDFNTMYVCMWYIFKVARAFYPRANKNSFGIPFSRDGLNVKIFTHHHQHHTTRIGFKGNNKKEETFCVLFFALRKSLNCTDMT